MMNLRKLEAFYLTAKYGSFSKAAEHLLISQPAVSVQVRELEQFFHLSLFRRMGKELKLTKAGRTLYHEAEKIFSIALAAEDRLKELYGMHSGVLNIGTTQSVARNVLRAPLSLFQSRHPMVKVVIKEGTAPQMLESIRAGETDLAVLPLIKSEKSLYSFPFRREEIFLVVHKNHKWFSRQDDIKIEELKNELFVLREEGSSVAYLIHKLFKKHSFTPDILLEGTLDYIKEVVKAGEAISFFAAMSMIDEVEHGDFKPLRLSSEKIILRFRVFFLEWGLLSAPAKSFADLLKTQSNDTATLNYNKS